MAQVREEGLVSQMHYIDHGAGGAAQCLQLLSTTRPQPGAGELLVEVAWAGVNRPDVLQRSGFYPPPADASPILGLEVAGRVAAVGEGVVGWCIGDRVAALTPGGGYAEFCRVPAAHALPVPADMDLARAAALPETWFTVWANLIDLGRLQAGERLLVHGGSSGIGLAALSLAKYLNVEVFTTVGSEAKARFCREFTQQQNCTVINYREEDFLERIKALTAGAGVDVVLDMVGGSYLQKNLRTLRRDGRMVQIAFLEGSKVEFDFMPLMMKRLTITGSTMRARTVSEKQMIRDALMKTVWPLLCRGELTTHIGARLPLSEAVEAHQLMESGQLIGKAVLEVAGSY